MTEFDKPFGASPEPAEGNDMAGDKNADGQIDQHDTQDQAPEADAEPQTPAEDPKADLDLSGDSPREIAANASEQAFAEADASEQKRALAAGEETSNLSPEEADRRADYIKVEPFDPSKPIDEMPTVVQSALGAKAKEQQDEKLADGQEKNELRPLRDGMTDEDTSQD